ncbi:MAG: anthranilate phosphoribosyltransferase [Actinomycetota bacterium]
MAYNPSPMSQLTWPGVLTRLVSRRDLEQEQAAWAMERIMQGEATPAQFGAFVVALRAKGETVEEISGMAATMRRFALGVPVEGPVVDTCGTGGDRASTINASTIAAFIVAGAGGRVAKHGNRAASSACGSADLLEALGVTIDLGPEAVATCINEVGMGFCFAPVFHPSMRHAGRPRAELGVPTVFNFLGPLTNPAQARHQALGVSDRRMAPLMAEVLARAGSVHALVLHACDGLDEVTLSGPTQVWELKDGQVTMSEIDPAALGLAPAPAESLRGGTPAGNAAVTLEVLGGAEGPVRDFVLVNAAAALVAADLVSDMAAGLGVAREAVDSGKALATVSRLRDLSNQLAARRS